jgi:tRNA threonylcarbamoyl adenosine modification protein YeaZ
MLDGIERASISAVVVGVGPGGFTGLRVGVATARGIAETLGVPLYGVSSLLVAAASSLQPGDVEVTASIAAGRGECFVQQVRVGSAGLLEASGPIRTLPVEDAPKPTPTTPDGLARVAHAASGAGDPLAVVPDYGREPDATPPRMDWGMDELRPDDLDRLLALEARCFDQPWTRGMYASELARPADARVQLAARDTGANGRLVGAALATRIGDEWHVMNVLVDPIARRRGIAARLMRELLERGNRIAPGARWLLEVRDGNDGAIALYEGLGFTQLGRRRGYYQDTGDDALVLARDGDVLARAREEAGTR